MYRRVVRFADASDLAASCAKRLLEELVSRQQKQDTVHLCLTGGRIANEVYARFGELVPDSDLDTSRLQLWWGDERFVPLSDPERNSQRTLATLAKWMPISPNNTHLMPAVDGKADPTEAAFAYAEDLGDVTFDICLLGVGADGHVASVFPNHPSFEATGKVIGITNAPKTPAERISLSLPMINTSRDIWILAVGQEKAAAIAGALANDMELPISHVQGRRATLFWLDTEAEGSPPYHECPF